MMVVYKQIACLEHNTLLYTVTLSLAIQLAQLVTSSVVFQQPAILDDRHKTYNYCDSIIQ